MVTQLFAPSVNVIPRAVNSYGFSRKWEFKHAEKVRPKGEKDQELSEGPRKSHSR